MEESYAGAPTTVPRELKIAALRVETGRGTDCLLERKIGQQAMEIEFLKKALRRFREHPLPVVGNGNAVSINKSGKRPKRGQR